MAVINKLVLFFLFFLVSCGEYVYVQKVVETVPKEETENLNYCLDFNAENPKKELPCSCSSDFTLSLDTTQCIDKNSFVKIDIVIDGNSALDREVYQYATIKINADEVDSSWTQELRGRIRGRGNSTWEFPKKPFKVKFDNKESLVGFPKDKEWVFLANYSDKTLIRSVLAFEMAKRLKMDYSPRYKIVNVSLNGKERGTYVLTEQIKESKDRVNISSEDITGGYLLELDQYRDGDYVFETNRGIPFVIKEPEPVSSEELNYITSYIQEVENVLNSSLFHDEEFGYRSLIDTESFIQWYLVNEILKNSDAANYSSIYYHKSSQQKLKMGPIWDFDTSAGNNNYTEAEYAEGWWIRTEGKWFAKLFNDPRFESEVKNKWRNLKEVGLSKKDLHRFIDGKAKALDQSQSQSINFNVWKIMGIYVWPNPVVFNNYNDEVSYLKEWLSTRIDWMEKELGD